MPRKPSTDKKKTVKESPKRELAERKAKSPSPKKAEEKPKKQSPKKSPKKKASPKVKKVGRKKSHPTYARMILDAFEDTKSKVLSGIAIAKFIEDSFPVPENFKRFLRASLKRESEAGNLVRVRGSYRLAKQGVEGGLERLKKPKKEPAKAAVKRSPRKKRAAVEEKDESEGEKAPKAAKKPRNKKEVKEKPKEAKEKVDRAHKEKEPKEVKEKEVKKKPARKGKADAESPKKVVAKKVRGKPRASLEKGEDDGEHGVNIAQSKHSHVWQYYDKKWCNYDHAASDVVEEVYLKYLANRGGGDVRAIKSGQWEYLVDFMAMKQTNIQHENHTVRDIRRVKNLAVEGEEESNNNNNEKEKGNEREKKCRKGKGKRRV